MARVFGGLVGLVLVALIVVGVLLLTHTSHKRPVGDVDKAADCWAKADAHGRRHCAS